MTLVVARRSFLLGLGASFVAAPAIVHAANIMPVRSFLVLPRFGWESFAPPPGMAYQWVARSVMGDAAMAAAAYIEPMTRAGWRPVDAKRYNRQFAIKGDAIEMGGQVLMETEMRGYLDRVVAASNRAVEHPNPFLQALLDAPACPDRDQNVTEIWEKGWVGCPNIR